MGTANRFSPLMVPGDDTDIDTTIKAYQVANAPKEAAARVPKDVVSMNRCSSWDSAGTQVSDDAVSEAFSWYSYASRTPTRRSSRVMPRAPRSIKAWAAETREEAADRDPKDVASKHCRASPGSEKFAGSSIVSPPPSALPTPYGLLDSGPTDGSAVLKSLLGLVIHST